MKPSSRIATFISCTSSSTIAGSSESILLRSIDLSLAKLCVSCVAGGGTQAGTGGLPSRLGEGGLNGAARTILVMFEIERSLSMR
jgi:hypothetical protein